MKGLISIFLIVSLVSCSKPVDENFVGQIEYINTYFQSYGCIDDTCCDVSYNWELNKLNDFFVLENAGKREELELDEQLVTERLPQKFVIHGDYVYLIFFNKPKNKIDSLRQFPLKKGDTLISSEEYHTYLNYSCQYFKTDTVPEGVKEICRDDFLSTDNKMPHIYLGDTIVSFVNQSFECYMFLKFNNKMTNDPKGIWKWKTIVYIDKKYLLPISEEHLTFGFQGECDPKDQWKLMSKLVPIKITDKSIN